jgi:hypothetical protein
MKKFLFKNEIENVYLGKGIRVIRKNSKIKKIKNKKINN